jgi:hypothetical protein
MSDIGRDRKYQERERTRKDSPAAVTHPDTSGTGVEVDEQRHQRPHRGLNGMTERCGEPYCREMAPTLRRSFGDAAFTDLE